jgi:hypothetical protein
MINLEILPCESNHELRRVRFIGQLLGLTFFLNGQQVVPNANGEVVIDPGHYHWEVFRNGELIASGDFDIDACNLITTPTPTSSPPDQLADPDARNDADADAPRGAGTENDTLAGYGSFDRTRHLWVPQAGRSIGNSFYKNWNLFDIASLLSLTGRSLSLVWWSVRGANYESFLYSSGRVNSFAAQMLSQRRVHRSEED